MADLVPGLLICLMATQTVQHDGEFIKLKNIYNCWIYLMQVTNEQQTQDCSVFLDLSLCFIILTFGFFSTTVLLQVTTTCAELIHLA